MVFRGRYLDDKTVKESKEVMSLKIRTMCLGGDKRKEFVRDRSHCIS